ncbi:MAG: hypothetical protein IJT01_06470 [Selenomonadaceae bacterium]|nr:hypothetical protein [Selenomonadaceae bacterium]
MALTAPTAPTPPTPPTPPTVTFEGGGSVTETTRPQSHGPQTEEEIHEQQAREAVANGSSGPLSKTTVTKPEEKGKEPTEPANQAPAGGSTTSRITVQQDGQAQMLLEEPEGQSVQTKQEAAPRIPESPSYHGMLYWGSTILSVAVLVAVLLRKVMFRKDEAQEKASPETAPSPVSEIKPRAGMTAAEVLQEIEVQETRQRMAPPASVAKEYASQSAVPPPKRKPPLREQPAPKPEKRQNRRGVQEEERERFEVRI